MSVKKHLFKHVPLVLMGCSLQANIFDAAKSAMQSGIGSVQSAVKSGSNAVQAAVGTVVSSAQSAGKSTVGAVRSGVASVSQATSAAVPAATGGQDSSKKTLSSADGQKILSAAMKVHDDAAKQFDYALEQQRKTLEIQMLQNRVASLKQLRDSLSKDYATVPADVLREIDTRVADTSKRILTLQAQDDTVKAALAAQQQLQEKIAAGMDQSVKQVGSIAAQGTQDKEAQVLAVTKKTLGDQIALYNQMVSIKDLPEFARQQAQTERNNCQAQLDALSKMGMKAFSPDALVAKVATYKGQVASFFTKPVDAVVSAQKGLVAQQLAAPVASVAQTPTQGLPYQKDVDAVAATLHEIYDALEKSSIPAAEKAAKEKQVAIDGLARRVVIATDYLNNNKGLSADIVSRVNADIQDTQTKLDALKAAK